MSTTATTLGPGLIDRSSAPHDGVTRALHWLTAVTVLLLYGLGLTWGLVPRGAFRHGMIVTHISLGIALSLVIVARLVWRLSPSSSPTVHAGLQGLAARLVHGALYVLLVAQAIFGWCWRWSADEPLGFFGLFTIPSPFTFPAGARHTFATLHYWTAHVIVALAFGHALAALAHHYLLKDQVLRRMTGRSGRTAAR